MPAGHLPFGSGVDYLSIGVQNKTNAQSVYLRIFVLTPPLGYSRLAHHLPSIALERGERRAARIFEHPYGAVSRAVVSEQRPTSCGGDELWIGRERSVPHHGWPGYSISARTRTVKWVV